MKKAGALLLVLFLSVPAQAGPVKKELLLFFTRLSALKASGFKVGRVYEAELKSRKPLLKKRDASREYLKKLYRRYAR
jgi:hypothetical protein